MTITDLAVYFLALKSSFRKMGRTGEFSGPEVGEDRGFPRGAIDRCLNTGEDVGVTRGRSHAHP